MQPQEQHARTKFITPGQLIEGTITEVYVNQEPFHCTIKILPKDPTVIIAEGRYSDHEISLGKLKRNLVHLKFSIRDVEDIIAGVESLEGRECIFRVDKSGWISWISRLIPKPQPKPPEAVPAPPIMTIDLEITEVYFQKVPGLRSIYTMESLQGRVLGWAVGPTGTGPLAHGWVLNLQSQDEAIAVRNRRKIPLDK